MRHRKVLALLGSYLDGELDPRLREAIEAHLRGCAACSRQRDACRAVDSLAVSVRVPDAPPAYWESFAGRVTAGLRTRESRISRKETPMFQDSFIVPERRTATRAVVFPLSAGRPCPSRGPADHRPARSDRQRASHRDHQRFPGPSASPSPAAPAAGQEGFHQQRQAHQARPGPDQLRSRPARRARRNPRPDRRRTDFRRRHRRRRGGRCRRRRHRRRPGRRRRRRAGRCRRRSRGPRPGHRRDQAAQAHQAGRARSIRRSPARPASKVSSSWKPRPTSTAASRP